PLSPTDIMTSRAISRLFPTSSPSAGLHRTCGQPARADFPCPDGQGETGRSVPWFLPHLETNPSQRVGPRTRTPSIDPTRLQGFFSSLPIRKQNGGPPREAVCCRAG